MSAKINKALKITNAISVVKLTYCAISNKTFKNL